MNTYKNFQRDDVEFARSVFIALIQSGQIRVTEMDLTRDQADECRAKMRMVLRQIFPLLGNALSDVDREISEVRRNSSNTGRPKA
jgi:hypothetical protein